MHILSNDQSIPVVLDARIVTGSGGGPEKTILNSPRFLKPLGYENICLYYYPDKDPGFELLQRRALAAEAQLIGIVDQGATDWTLVKQTVELCRKRNVSIWHAHDYKTHLLGILVRRHWPMYLVTTLHGWGHLGWKMGLYYVVGQSCLYFYDEVIAVSQELYDDARRWQVSKKRLHTIFNAIDTQDYQRSFSKEDARSAICIEFGGSTQVKGLNARPLVGALGRLSPEKGFDALIDAVFLLKQRGVEVDLWIAGDGPLRESLLQQIDRLGLESQVQLLGHLSDPKKMLQALDLFVLSSHREGLPNVVLEAMALQVPIVSTRVGEVPTMLENDKSAFLVSRSNTQELAVAIGKLAGNPSLQSSFAAAARLKVEQSYDFGQRMARIAALYDRLLMRQRTDC